MNPRLDTNTENAPRDPVPFQLNSFKGEKRKNIEHMALFVSKVVIAIYCTSMLQFACIQNMAVSEHANETGHVPV